MDLTEAYLIGLNEQRSAEVDTAPFLRLISSKYNLCISVRNTSLCRIEGAYKSCIGIIYTAEIASVFIDGIYIVRASDKCVGMQVKRLVGDIDALCGEESAIFKCRSADRFNTLGKHYRCKHVAILKRLVAYHGDTLGNVYFQSYPFGYSFL